MNMKIASKSPQLIRKNLLEHLPREAREIVKSSPKRQREVEVIVKEIFERYGEDISALAKY
ncbi:hypothetical protein HYW31_01255 [Candidatus Berkelbacteria bacterium]|nr:hypothetical protein [Candidatus Berkelbacteria bacterium]